MTDIPLAKDARSYRLENIDILRGLVIIIMALDHVRDYISPTGLTDPMAGTDIDPTLFFTRWITHFCAPVFVFLAGTSAGLMADRKSPNDLGSFLLKRGLWLIFVDAVIISIAWTFEPFGSAAAGGLFMASMGVLWVIGASMIVLAGCQYLGARLCLIIGITILLGHNLLDGVWPIGNYDGADPLWVGMHSQSITFIGPFQVFIIYPLLPWIGIMLAGFGSAFVFTKAPAERDRFLVKTGLVMITAFIVIRGSGLYGDTNLWAIQEGNGLQTFFDFMNVTKYPPSLLFTLATLGPMAIFCAYSERMNSRIKNTLIIFGRAPFAFYVVHLYLAHALSICLGVYQGFGWQQFITGYWMFPKGYGVNMLVVYIAWALVVILLYPLCKWVAEVKSRRKDWWLSYL